MPAHPNPPRRRGREYTVPPEEDLILVAHIVKARGLRGEVVADLLTDFPDRFARLDSLIGIGPDKLHRSLQIEEHWFHGERLVFKFAGFDTVDEAKQLVGYDLAVPSAERVDLPDDTFYQWELVGCRVETIDGSTLGEVKDIMRTGGVEILTVVDENGRERLIPMASEIVVEIDKGRKLIRVDPPEGLLEL